MDPVKAALNGHLDLVVLWWRLLLDWKNTCKRINHFVNLHNSVKVNHAKWVMESTHDKHFCKA